MSSLALEVRENGEHATVIGVGRRDPELHEQTWASGDFAVIASRMALISERLVHDADLRAGWRVLDVATSGNDGRARAAACRRAVAAALGDRGAPAGLFADRLASLETTEQNESPEAFVDEFRTWYGPTLKAFAALEGDPDASDALERDLVALARRSDRLENGAVAIPATYLEAIAVVA
jgi:hypothetical protein